METIDFRSDSPPGPAGKEAGGDAAALEARCAELLGKEAALWVPDRDRAGLCGVAAHAAPGMEVLLADRCHMVHRQSGLLGRHAEAALRAVSPESPHLRPEDIFTRIRDRQDARTPDTGLICVEQGTEDGTVVPPEILSEVFRVAHKRGIPVFMDGARLLHAAAALGVEPKELARSADSVAVSLDKALGAPAGCVLAGSRDFIDKAKSRGARLPGGKDSPAPPSEDILAGLDDALAALRKDHERAVRLANRLDRMSGVRLVREPEMNLVFIKLPGYRDPGDLLLERLRSRGILVAPDEWRVWRLALHRGVTDAHADALVAELGSILSSGAPPPGYP